jgi:hypothetical protein
MSRFKLHACWPQTWAGTSVLLLCLSRTLQAETCLLCSKDIMLPQAEAPQTRIQFHTLSTPQKSYAHGNLLARQWQIMEL